MKRNFILAFVLLPLLAVFGCSSKNAELELTAKVDNISTKVITCDVEGMTCTGCEVNVKMAVNKIDGVIEVKASFTDGTAEVTVDPEKVSEQDVIDAINKMGYKAKKADSGG